MSAQPPFDVASVPFSYHGSWMSLSIPARESELFFRNHHMQANTLFAVRPVWEGKPLAVQYEMRPTELVLHTGRGTVEICFASPDSVRMRGKGIELWLVGKHIHAYRNGPGLAVFNIRRAYRRYQFEMLAGSLDLKGAYASEQEDLVNLSEIEGQGVWANQAEADRDKQILRIVPAADGCWEIAIDECWSSWQRLERGSFASCREAAAASFDSFLASMPPAPDPLAETRRLAAYINWSCTVNPSGLVKRPTLFMSKNWMNNVWSWDQCFNAMALAKGQPELAMDQMLTLVDHQDAFGAYTDAFNDMQIHYNYSKPPVHGFAYRELQERLPPDVEASVRETMYTSLCRQADWWMTYRCYGTEGLGSLPYYLHGNDSGWDNSTMFAKGVPLVSPDLSALLVVQMDVLAGLATQLDRPDESRQWQERADLLYEGLMQHLWRHDHFVARLANDGSDVPCQSLIPCLPLMLGKRLPEDVRDSLHTNIRKHLTAWGLATERVDSASYLEDGYWRGPIWAPSTYLAVVGLERSGFADTATDIAKRFCRLCKVSGFAENFNACTGEPLRDPAYTWTASVFLLLAERTCASD